MIENKISTSDRLALERTKLANERTSLAYFRTSLVFFGSGIAFFKIDILDNLGILGYVFIIMAVIILVIGIARFFYVKKKIAKYYTD